MPEEIEENTIGSLAPWLITSITTLVLQISNDAVSQAEQEKMKQLLYSAALREASPLIGDDPNFADTLPVDRLYKILADKVKADHPNIHELACVKHEYCKRKADWIQEGATTGGILAFAISLLADMAMTLGLASLLFLIAYSFFDKLCDC